MWEDDERSDDSDMSVDPDPRTEGMTNEKIRINSTIICEHPSVGFYANVLIPDCEEDSTDRISISLSHQLLGASPRYINVHLPANNRDPIQYVRLSKLIGDYPTILRVHWLARLRSFAMPMMASTKGTEHGPGSLLTRHTHKQ